MDFSRFVAQSQDFISNLQNGNTPPPRILQAALSFGQSAFQNSDRAARLLLDEFSLILDGQSKGILDTISTSRTTIVLINAALLLATLLLSLYALRVVVTSLRNSFHFIITFIFWMFTLTIIFKVVTYVARYVETSSSYLDGIFSRKYST